MLTNLWSSSEAESGIILYETLNLWSYVSISIGNPVRPVVSSLESLPSNPAARVRFPAGSGILISILGLGVCSLPLFCPVLCLADALIFCWPSIQRGSHLYSCLEFWFIVSDFSYRRLTHEYLGCKSLGVGYSNICGVSGCVNIRFHWRP